MPKEEPWDYDFPPEPEAPYPRHVGVENNVASSSGSNMRSSLIGMGFAPPIVDKVLEEEGEADPDYLMERLFELADDPNSNYASMGSDNLFADKNGTRPQTLALIQPKEEPDMFDEYYVDKKASLLSMNFTEKEIDFALDKLGDAPVNEIVDFITAAQIAEQIQNESSESSSEDEDDVQEDINQALFGTMNKTLRLIEMGFSEADISLAIEKYGADKPILELADSILTGRIALDYEEKPNVADLARRKPRVVENPRSFTRPRENAEDIKTEDIVADASQPRDIDLRASRKGKRLRKQYANDPPVAGSQPEQPDYDDLWEGDIPKEEYMDDLGSFLEPPDFEEEKVDPDDIASFGIPMEFNSNSGEDAQSLVAEPPYFFYGNVHNLHPEIWIKLSKFLYGTEPEFADTRFFSALSRREGYIHDLPRRNRFRVPPLPPTTINDTIPGTKKWWPSWDTRNQLSGISTDIDRLQVLCDRLGKMLTDSHGHLSPEQQRRILYNCKTLNLIWTGLYKLSPVEPEHWERILGYPMNFTQAPENSKVERLQALKNSFQTDALGYYLSVLKLLFPEGLTVLSIFSGIGGVEVALHRLGIRLKGVVSVEPNDAQRSILRKWWETTKQTGQLVEINGIERLTVRKLESLFERFGGFDLVICQDPGTISKLGLKMSAIDASQAFDFPLFHEFVRVVQRVKSMMGKKR